MRLSGLYRMMQKDEGGLFGATLSPPFPHYLSSLIIWYSACYCCPDKIGALIPCYSYSPPPFLYYIFVRPVPEETSRRAAPLPATSLAVRPARSADLVGDKPVVDDDHCCCCRSFYEEDGAGCSTTTCSNAAPHPPDDLIFHGRFSRNHTRCHCVHVPEAAPSSSSHYESSSDDDLPDYTASDWPERRCVQKENDAETSTDVTQDSTSSQAQPTLVNHKTRRRRWRRHPSTRIQSCTTHPSYLSTLNHFTFWLSIFFSIFVFSSVYIAPCSATHILPRQLANFDKDSPSTAFFVPHQRQSFSSFNKIRKRDTAGISGFSATNNVNEDDLKDDAEAPPTVLVNFTRSISFSGNDFSRIPDFGKDEVFTITESDFPIKLKCKAELHPYFWPDNDTNVPLKVSWIDGKHNVLSQNENLVLRQLDNQSDYRCIANIPPLGRIVAGRLLSRAVKFKTRNDPTISIEPTMSNVSVGGNARLICTITNRNGSEKLAWRKDGRLLEANERIRIFTIDQESILHILNTTSSDNGTYSCELEDRPEFSIAHASIHTFQLSESSKDQPKSLVITPPPTVYVRQGEETIIECLFPLVSAKTRWYKVEKDDYDVVTRHFLGSDIAYIFNHASPSDSGNYICEAKDDTHEFKHRFTLEVYNLDDTNIDYEEEYFNNVTKKQGTPFKLLCPIYLQLDESPDMATWYKDGQLIKPLPRHKITKVTGGHVPGLVLLISIVEAADEGIYQCVVRKGDSERLQQTALSVEVTTNETLKNFIVTIDHVKACFNLFFDVPQSLDQTYARLATYFLIYYNSDNSTSLNSVPLSSAICINWTCTLTCCSPNFSFKHATNYTLQISMVLSEEGSVITPLSEPVHITSWDTYATKGLDIEAVYLDQSEELLIKWQGPPSGTVEGDIQKYVLEMLNATRRSTIHLSNLPKISINLSKDESIFRLSNITKPFAYRMRIIPITRAGFPPSFALESMENFGYMLFTSNEDEIGAANADLASPEIDVAQMELRPVLEVTWKPPKEVGKGANRITKIVIKYQLLMKPRRKNGIVERPIGDEKTELFKNVESGEMYQVCASYMTSVATHGFWKCITTPVRNSDGKLSHYSEDEMNIPDELPLPVVCEEANCQCEESPLVKGGLRVRWDPPKPPAHDKEYDDEEIPEESYPPATYILHYTLNETDPSGEDFMTQVPMNKFFVDLPILLPNTTYRIMIEAINEQGNGVDGSFFSCTTPLGAELPPPNHLSFIPINETAAKIEWEPIKLNKNSTVLNGYTLFWQQDGRMVQNRTILGSENNSTVLTNLTTESIYELHIASYSHNTGTSNVHSSKVVMKLPKDLNKKRHAPVPFHETKEFKAAVVLALLCVAVILCCCLGAICGYFKCKRTGKYKRIWSWCRKKKRNQPPTDPGTELQLMPRLSINSGSAILSHSEIPPSTGRTTLPSIPEIDLERERLLELSTSPRGAAVGAANQPMIDAKGGPGGFRPRGYRRYQQLLSENPEFLSLIAEMNQESICSQESRSRSSIPMSTEVEITSCPLDSASNHKNSLGSMQKSPEHARTDSRPESNPGPFSSPPFSHSVITAEVHDEPPENLSSIKTESDQGLSDIPSINTSEHVQTSPRAVSYDQLNEAKPNGRRGKGSSESMEVPRSKSSSALNHFFDRPSCDGFRPPCTTTLWHPVLNSSRHEAPSPITVTTKHETDSDSHSLYEQRMGPSSSNGTNLPMNPPAASLPNLTDSGIVFDDLHGTNGYGTTSSKSNAHHDHLDYMDDYGPHAKAAICHSDSRLVFVSTATSTLLTSPSKPTAAESACTTFDLASLFESPPNGFHGKLNGHMKKANGYRINHQH